MATDAELMEASLLAVAESGSDIRTGAFDRFFAAFPERRAVFYNYDAATPRMTNETIEMMFGLATDEKWVWYQIAALVFNHRNYGDLPQAEYDAFVDFSVDALGAAAGDVWSPDCDAAWRRQAARLKAMIAEAR